jgi:hypothetical protein
VERTLLAPEGEEARLCEPRMLETLESALVPECDSQTMEHVCWEGIVLPDRGSRKSWASSKGGARRQCACCTTNAGRWH